jgi:transposase
MKDTALLGLALGLRPPWEVSACVFESADKRLEIELDFARGAVFACPACAGQGCKVHDTERRRWRHLNFFQHECYLNARLPRVECPACGVKTVDVPWARPGSGFTLLFEAYVMLLGPQMPVAAMARLVGEHDTRLWRVLRHYVEEARGQQDLSAVKRVGIDETARARGHEYISVVVDMDRSAVICATEGKDAAVVEAFTRDLERHGGKAEQIQEVCCDMSPAFIKGVEEKLERAAITFDKFHVIKLMGEAVDQVRRRERLERPELARTRWHWLKNPERLKVEHLVELERMMMPHRKLKTARAYMLRLTLQDFYAEPPEGAELFLRKWCAWAMRSRLESVKKVARTLREHWEGVLRWFRSRINNGVLEGINSLIQAAKAKARGYRSTRNLLTMVYLIAGKLDFKLPT